MACLCGFLAIYKKINYSLKSCFANSCAPVVPFWAWGVGVCGDPAAQGRLSPPNSEKPKGVHPRERKICQVKIQ